MSTNNEGSLGLKDTGCGCGCDKIGVQIEGSPMGGTAQTLPTPTPTHPHTHPHTHMHRKQKCIVHWRNKNAPKHTGKERHAKQMQTNEQMEGINKKKKILPLTLFTI